MKGTEQESHLLLVDAGVLPEVFVRVLEAKQLLASGKASSSAEAARVAGISRSAFYKYRDAVFPYDVQKSGRIISIHVELRDQPGILSQLLSTFASAGANILTVNQNIPAEGKALVSISARIDGLSRPAEALISAVSATEGVCRVLRIGGEE